MTSRLSERQLMSLEECETSSSVPRPVLRRDMPICWLDSAQRIKADILNFELFFYIISLEWAIQNICCICKQRVDYKTRPDKDILTKLHGKVFTRHIVRQILGHLSDTDLRRLNCVSLVWRTILNVELSNVKINKITAGMSTENWYQTIAHWDRNK